MDSQFDDALAQAVSELKDLSLRRAAARAATAHQFLNAVAQARVLHDLETLAQERVNTRQPHRFTRIFERVFSSSSPQPHTPTDFIIEAEVVYRSSGPISDAQSSSPRLGQPSVVIVITPPDQSDDDPSRSL